jgi:hypothetical protein
MLLAGRETTGTSLEIMYCVHLDSADKQALYRERREAATLAKTHSGRRDRQREKDLSCMQMRCANRTRDGRISEKKDAPKKPSAPFLMYWYFVLCTNGCDLREVSVVGCLGSVEGGDKLQLCVFLSVDKRTGDKLLLCRVFVCSRACTRAHSFCSGV